MELLLPFFAFILNPIVENHKECVGIVMQKYKIILK